MGKHIFKPIETASLEFGRSKLEIIYSNQCLSIPEIRLYENHLYVNLIGLHFMSSKESPSYFTLLGHFGDLTDKEELYEADFIEEYEDCQISDIHANEKMSDYDFFSSNPDDYPDRTSLKHWRSL